jgi:hypothetical protein
MSNTYTDLVKLHIKEEKTKELKYKFTEIDRIFFEKINTSEPDLEARVLNFCRF